MSDLDLSFATSKEEIEKPVKTGALDLSFATVTPNRSPAELTGQIMTQQSEGGFPQGARNERGFFNKIGDVITGNDRETQATKKLPELGTEIGLDEFLGGGNVLTGAAVSTAPDPTEIVKILSENATGELTVRPDEAGNVIVGHNGKEAILNKPGFSKFDAVQLGALMSAFFPSSKLAAGASTLKGAALRVGAGTATTQAGIESLQASQEGDFDTGDVALAGITAGGFQLGLQRLAQSIPGLREKIKSAGITEEVRNLYRETAVKLGFKPEDITDDIIRSSVDDVSKAVTPTESLAIQGEKEFAIPLTQGQRSLSDAALSAEDRARSGVSGESAQRVIRGFEEQQQIPAVNQAREAVESQIGGQEGAGSIVREGVKQAELLADDAVSEAFESVGKAELSPQGLKNVLKNVNNSVRSIEFDRTLPQTAGLLKQVQNLNKVIKTFKGLKDVDLKRIEQMRRRINTAVGAADNPVDKRQVTIMKRAFDDALDDAVQNALFSGDDQSLAALKNARGLFSEYAKKFRAQPKRGKSGRIVDRDEAGQFVEKIIDANPTDEQIVNAVFGASGLNKGSGSAMAARFRGVLGDDSEGWAAIRQAAVKRLIKTNRVNGTEIVSGSKTLTAINDAIEKNGTLVNELFTKQEIGLLKRFAVQVKRTQPDLVRSRENPSGTAQVAVKAVGDLLTKLSVLTGDGTIFVTSKGVQAAKGFSNTAKAKNAVKPFSELKNLRPTAVPAAEAVTQKLKE